MPTTAVHDPAAIEAEIEEQSARRDRLQDEVAQVEEKLQDARTRLQAADEEDARSEALSDVRRLQTDHDALTGAVEAVQEKIESLRARLHEARAAQQRENQLEALAEKGRTAVEAREEFEAVRDEILEVLREKAPELARLFAAWLDAADTFRGALTREETHALQRPSKTTDEDTARALTLISEMKEREVVPFQDAVAPAYTSVPAYRWEGVEDKGDRLSSGPLREAVDSIREFGKQSSSNHE